MFLQLALNLGLGSGGSSRQPALCLALLVLCFALLRCCFAAPCFALLCLGGSHCDNLGSRETVHKPGFPHLDPAHNEHNQAWANKSCRGCFNTHTHTHNSLLAEGQAKAHKKCWFQPVIDNEKNAAHAKQLATSQSRPCRASDSTCSSCA